MRNTLKILTRELFAPVLCNLGVELPLDEVGGTKLMRQSLFGWLESNDCEIAAASTSAGAVRVLFRPSARRN
jgi:hypothetical protein